MVVTIKAQLKQPQPNKDIASNRSDFLGMVIVLTLPKNNNNKKNSLVKVTAHDVLLLLSLLSLLRSQ